MLRNMILSFGLVKLLLGDKKLANLFKYIGLFFRQTNMSLIYSFYKGVGNFLLTELWCEIFIGGGNFYFYWSKAQFLSMR